MRKGDTILFETPPRVAGHGSVGGRREAQGPLAKEFDTLITETQCGEKTWEKAESTFARTALETALHRAGATAADLCAVFAGDLQCQCTASAYLMRDVDAPYLGLYGACISAVTFGRVRDLEVKDINNMGAAMAPAAAETIRRYFSDTGEAPAAFDAVYTGDLGAVGSQLLAQLLERDGLVLHNHQDCGLLVFDRATQDVQAGGSGAGCSASVLCCHVLPRLEAGKLRRVLFLSTGALMSQTTFLQGESIPGVAHLVELRCAKEEAE